MLLEWILCLSGSWDGMSLMNVVGLYETGEGRKVLENNSMLYRELVEIFKFWGNTGMRESVNHKCTAGNALLLLSMLKSVDLLVR